ncbi:MAG: YgjV family protein [Ruminococcaceae bacterium]|nr:YgjV family protein [Oscillospiraceae bacterium]
MELKEIIGQIFGIFGLLMFVSSFQCKNSKKLVFVQGIGGLMFFINFLLIGAYGGALFNLTILIRGLLYIKKDKIWKPLIVEILFTLAYVYSLVLIKDDILQIVLTTLPYLSLLVMSALMWKENGKSIRVFQVGALSPSWLIHNIFNFTLGGILAEVFNMISAIVSLLRFKNNAQ